MENHVVRNGGITDSRTFPASATCASELVEEKEHMRHDHKSKHTAHPMRLLATITVLVAIGRVYRQMVAIPFEKKGISTRKSQSGAFARHVGH